MDSKRLEDKIDKVVEKIGNIDVTLAKQSVVLEEHVKRTNLLEKNIEPLKKQHDIISCSKDSWVYGPWCCSKNNTWANERERYVMEKKEVQFKYRNMPVIQFKLKNTKIVKLGIDLISIYRIRN